MKQSVTVPNVRRLEPEGSGPDVPSERIPDEQWEDRRPVKISRSEAKKEEVEKKEELVREVRKRQTGRKYAEQQQGSIPGLEGHSMKWMRDLIGQGISYIA